jgi:two-component system sensor histidine kinase EvgS
LLQILSNLIGNAIKFTNDGYVRLTVYTENKRTIEDTSLKAGTVVDLVMEVTDTGIGIPEHLQNSVFDEFVQAEDRKTQGTGLGLAITRRLVNLMGGTVSFTSAVNQGSTFKVVIPEVSCVDNVDSRSTGRAVNPESIEFEKATILVVDDYEVNRNYLKDALKKSKIEVLQASNGDQALQIAKRHNPCLIITDTRMPKMDGFKLLEKIKRDRSLRHIPVIAYTASAMKASRQRILESDFAGLLVKPVLVSELYQELCKHLPFKQILPEHGDRDQHHGEIDEKIHDQLSLIASLESGFMQKYEAYTKRQPIAEIKAFGNELQELGTSHNSRLLIQYGEEMVNAADNFNIERILVLINRFPELVRQIKSL